jgi:intein/homing endonuclease
MEILRVKKFFNSDFKEFANYDNYRSIPSICDGFKPTQRKIIATLLKRGESASEIKVSSLAGLLISEMDYHHGECLKFDTEILLSDGSKVKIGEWAEQYPEVILKVISYDITTNTFIESEGYFPRKTKEVTEIFNIEMENGEIFSCTDNHPFLVKRKNKLEYVPAKLLKEDDDIVSY